MGNYWIPRDMRVAPELDPAKTAGPVCEQHALLINPFYPKDPHASFGKHVLTPTLALTSIAGSTPDHWHVPIAIAALRAGHSFGQAHDSVLADHPTFDLGAVLGLLLAGNAITSLTTKD